MRNVLVGLALSFSLAASALLIAACSGATPPPGPDSGANTGPSTPPDPSGTPAGNPACDRPERKYMSRDPNQCAVMRFFCEAGKVAFHDDCGCGCEPPPPGAGDGNGAACGKNTCTADQFCCNPSCGICAPKGGSCIQQVCD